MSKIFKLFINENIKTWKKFSTKLSIILTILALVGVLGLVKVMEYVNDNAEYAVSVYDWKEATKQQIKSIEQSLKNEDLDNETIKMMQIELEKCEMALEYDINPYSNYWKSTILNKISEIKQQGENETEITKLIKILKEDNFSSYIEIQKDTAKKSLENKEITQEEYNDEILILDLKDKYEIGKKEDDEYWRRTMISNIQTMQKSIRTGIDYKNNKVLTVEKKQEYEETIKMNIYRLENNIVPIEYVNNNYRIIFETLAPGFVTAIIAIVAIIIAGGAIATEVSTGTIKFWALTPNKRWKILSAKILSILFYIIVLTLVMSLLTVACSNLFFDAEGNEYIYVKNGNVEKIGNTLFTIEYYFAKTIPIIIFALFALMLSTITRSSAVSVSLSVAIYMGYGIVMAIINSYIKKDWIRFVPFNNLNIADKIFPNFNNPMSMFGESTFATSTSLEFSLGVLVVCAILMLVTMYDSFNNRDII